MALNDSEVRKIWHALADLNDRMKVLEAKTQQRPAVPSSSSSAHAIVPTINIPSINIPSLKISGSTSGAPFVDYMQLYSKLHPFPEEFDRIMGKSKIRWNDVSGDHPTRKSDILVIVLYSHSGRVFDEIRGRFAEINKDVYFQYKKVFYAVLKALEFSTIHPVHISDGDPLLDQLKQSGRPDISVFYLWMDPYEDKTIYSLYRKEKSPTSYEDNKKNLEKIVTATNK